MREKLFGGTGLKDSSFVQGGGMVRVTSVGSEVYVGGHCIWNNTCLLGVHAVSSSQCCGSYLKPAF